MDRQRLEARVLQIVALVESGRGVEDDRVELKSDWPSDFYKAARQIAGLANASRSDDVLWIVGLDERTGVVDALAATEVSGWWGQVARCFDEQTPDPQFLSVPTGNGQHVVALFFDTSRAPYLVNVQGGGRVEREVPWRAGNSTRTAHRRELLSTVVSRARVPELELVNGHLWVAETEPYSGTGDEDDPTHEVRFRATIFVSAIGEATLPQHRQLWTARVGSRDPLPLHVSARGPFRFGQTGPSDGRSHTDAGIIDVLEHSGLVVHGSGEIQVNGHAYLRGETIQAFQLAPWVELQVNLPIDRSEVASDLQIRFNHVPGSEDPADLDNGRARTLAEFEPIIGERA